MEKNGNLLVVFIFCPAMLLPPRTNLTRKGLTTGLLASAKVVVPSGGHYKNNGSRLDGFIFKCSI